MTEGPPQPIDVEDIHARLAVAFPAA
jgi:hypothetical protein